MAMWPKLAGFAALTSICTYVPPSRAQEPARQALDPASQASEPASQASEPASQASVPASQASEPASQASEALRSAWLALRPDWLALRPGWLALGPSRGGTDRRTQFISTHRLKSSFFKHIAKHGPSLRFQPNFLVFCSFVGKKGLAREKLATVC